MKLDFKFASIETKSLSEFNFPVNSALNSEVFILTFRLEALR